MDYTDGVIRERGRGGDILFGRTNIGEKISLKNACLILVKPAVCGRKPCMAKG